MHLRTPHPSYRTPQRSILALSGALGWTYSSPVLRAAWHSFGLAYGAILMGYELGRLPSLLLTRETQNVFTCSISRRLSTQHEGQPGRSKMCHLLCSSGAPVSFRVCQGSFLREFQKRTMPSQETVPDSRDTNTGESLRRGDGRAGKDGAES